MRIKELFTIPEGEKVTEKLFGRVLISSICSILLCMACLAGTTWAWYTVSIENRGNEIQIATVNANVDIQDGENNAVNADPNGRYTFGLGTYMAQINLENDATEPQSPVYVVISVFCNEETKYYYLTFENGNKTAMQEFRTGTDSAMVSFSVSWVKPVSAVAVGSEAIIIGESMDEPENEPTTETTIPGTGPSTETTPDVQYFASLSDALQGIPGNESPEGAVVKVVSESNMTVVTLLQDIELAEPLEVETAVILDLNGHTVHSASSPAIRVVSDSTIKNGTVSQSGNGTGTAAVPTIAIEVLSGTVFEMTDAKVEVTDAGNGTVIGISSAAGSTLTLSGTDVIVSTGKSLGNAGVYAKGKAVLTDCSVIAEADYTGANNAYTSQSKGIIAEQELELYNCYVWGAHSGVVAYGSTLVNGGTYEGYGHGAFYLAASEKTAYFYNAAFNWAAMREGTYADTVAGTNNAAFYLGADSNITAYFDNCSFKSNNATKSYCLVLRSSSGEHNNSVYVSNSSFSNYKKYAYRIGNSGNATELYAYSGIGNTYSGRVFNYDNKGTYTEESYKPS